MQGLLLLLAMPSVSGLLGQSLNIDAMRVLKRVAFQPGLAVAHIAVPHIGYVDWKALRSAGVKGVVFDKDNTLTAPYVDALDTRVVPAIDSCVAAFGASNVLIMSNSAGGPDDKGYVDAARVEEALGLAVLRRQSKKPKGFEELLQWFNRGESSICPPSTCASITATAAAADSNNGGEARLAVKPHELCMVGDRSLTDVVFGNVHGMLTIHTLPLTLKGDNAPARVLRSLENRALVPLTRVVAAAGATRACRPPPHRLLAAAEGASPFILDLPLT